MSLCLDVFVYLALLVLMLAVVACTLAVPLPCALKHYARVLRSFGVWAANSSRNAPPTARLRRVHPLPTKEYEPQSCCVVEACSNRTHMCSEAPWTAGIVSCPRFALAWHLAFSSLPDANATLCHPLAQARNPSGTNRACRDRRSLAHHETIAT